MTSSSGVIDPKLKKRKKNMTGPGLGVASDKCEILTEGILEEKEDALESTNKKVGEAAVSSKEKEVSDSHGNLGSFSVGKMLVSQTCSGEETGIDGDKGETLQAAKQIKVGRKTDSSVEFGSFDTCDEGAAAEGKSENPVDTARVTTDCAKVVNYAEEKDGFVIFGDEKQTILELAEEEKSEDNGAKFQHTCKVTVNGSKATDEVSNINVEISVEKSKTDLELVDVKEAVKEVENFKEIAQVVVAAAEKKKSLEDITKQTVGEGDLEFLGKKKKKSKVPKNITVTDRAAASVQSRDNLQKIEKDIREVETNEEKTDSEILGKKKSKKPLDLDTKALTKDSKVEDIEPKIDLEFFGKKKKRKKRTPLDLDAEEAAVAASAEQKSEKPQDTDGKTDFEFFGKKKKKKPKEPLLEGGAEAADLEDATEDMIDFETFGKKKKSKKVRFNIEGDAASELRLQTDEGAADEKLDEEDRPSSDWSSSDRDYTYEELLSRAVVLLREKNPNMEAGRRQKFVMRPPQVVRIGTKKTSFANFSDVCRMLHRQPKHLLAFLLAELGTSGSVDGNLQLVIRGRFQQKQIENVLRRYIREYVTCHTCRSPNTILQKDTRLFFLQCETCGSRCSVTSIKSGFQALTGKRAALRAKAT